MNMSIFNTSSLEQAANHTARPIPRVAALGLLACGLLAAPLHAAGDWAAVQDPKDMADTSGDIRAISARVKDGNLHLSMSVHGVAAPATDQTPAGMQNRYYYHWLLDTDNNPATGRSNSEYEGNPTNLQKPIGTERVVMIGWRDGKPNGVEVYDPLDEDTTLIADFTYQASGNTLTAVIPLADLGLTLGQTIAVSAFQEGASDGWAVDWIESDTLTLGGLNPATAWVTDPKDMADTSGDIRGISAHAMGGNLYLSMTVHGVAAPAVNQTPAGMQNRYYYHWLLDTDNNPATGRSNSEYEGNPTNLQKPIGAERVVMIGWRDGKPNGIEVYDPLDEDTTLLAGFPYQTRGNTLTAVIPLAALGLTEGQTIAISAFQEGASDGWAVDWIESATLTLAGPTMPVASVMDPTDMADSSGDLRAISAHVEGASLFLSMTVHGVAAPSVEQTPTGMQNRYYYHWLLDTDNNPATGRSNSEYEGNPTNLQKPIGTERVVMIGWRNGKPNGVEVYDPLDEDTTLVADFTYQASGNTLTAVIPLADLGLTVGQTIAISAFQEGASDGWAVDWIESATLTLDPPTAGRMKIDGLFQDWADAAAAGVVAGVDDPQDMADSSGDIRQIQATVEAGYLYLRMTVEGIALPSVAETPAGMQNRYYYHWLLDTDNNPATGRSNSEYEGNPTNLQKPIGTERVVMIGWRNGAPNGIEVYDPLDEDVTLLANFEFQAGGNSVEARIRLADLGLSLGQTIGFSAFQEGASDGWAVDWVESVAVTLTEGGPAGMTLETIFAGDPYGFEIRVQDNATDQVDPATVTVRVDGQPVTPNVSKSSGLTLIVGRHPSLLPPNTLHTVSLALQASGKPQSKDFVFKVDPYTVLPMAGRLALLNKANGGFVVNVTQISNGGQATGVTSLHENRADLAEQQLVGLMKDPVTGLPYFNEPELDWAKWVITPQIVTQPINWFELAPGVDASLNFPNDQAIPKLPAFGLPVEGVVLEILTYLDLSPGYHKIGMYTEGGHKVTAGLRSTDPVLSLFDATDDPSRVPTYFARNQFFDVVAIEAGYYPIRILWFQSKRRQEQGLMLEVFSVKDRQLHLVNDTANASSIRAYRAGLLLNPGALTPTIALQRQGPNVTLQWRGMLQMANSVTGPWTDYADDSQSPLTFSASGQPAKFARSRGY